MRKNDLSEFKLEQEGFKITLRRGSDFQPVITTTTAAPLTFPTSAPIPGSSTPATAASSGPKDNLRDIVSPMVGTFYSAISPESPPCVAIGQEVSEDTVVCIIEAMKVMNEIKPEPGIRGTVVEIVAENGKPVQFGEVLFRVR